MRPLTFSIALLTLCTAQAAFAQQTGTGTVTGSGATIEEGPTIHDVIANIRALAPERDPQKLKDVLVPDTKQKAWDNESEQAYERLWTHRTDCREAIRRANRDQLMQRLLPCYRSDLLQDINILRKQSQYIQAVPLSDETLRTTTMNAITALTDAQMTIVNAIDTGLFEQADAVEEAKRNLREKYREPVWTSLVRLKADRELTWVIYMAKNIEMRMPAEGRADAIGVLLSDAAICLENAGKTLRDASLQADRKTSLEMLKNGRDQAQGCRKTLKKAAQKEALADAEKAENNEPQQ